MTTSIGRLVVNFDFLVVKWTLFDLIIGISSLERLQACIDVGWQHIHVTVCENTAKLSLIIMDVTQVAQRGT